MNTRPLKNEAAANWALAPVNRLADAGWSVGAQALAPVKPRARATVAPVKPAGLLARIVSIFSAR